MKQEYINHCIDKAIEEYPEWPEQVKYLLVFTPRYCDGSTIAVTSLLEHEVVFGHPLYRVTLLSGNLLDLAKDNWFKVTPEMYHQRKEGRLI